MPHTLDDDKKVRVSATEKAADPNPPRLRVTRACREALESFLGPAIEQRLQEQEDLKAQVDEFRQYIKGENPRPPMAASVSHVASPFILYARSRMLAKLVATMLRQKPVVKIEPVRGKDDPDANKAANALTKVFEALMGSSRELDGNTALRKAAADDVDTGLGAWAVRRIPYEVYNQPVLTAGPGEPPFERINRRGFVRWEAIPVESTLYFERYGSNTRRMPFAGFVTNISWATLKARAAGEYYDPEVADEVREVLETDAALDATLPIDAREHKIAEVHLDYDIELQGGENSPSWPRDGIPESITVDYHVTARKILRVASNRYDEGARPIVFAAFDMPANPHALRGQGVPEKLLSVQRTADAVYNITIEAGKRAMSNLLILKKGGSLEDEFGEADSLVNGVGYTEDPDKDAKSLPLGQPDAAQHGLMLLQQQERYVGAILGEDDAAGGVVESAKRVPGGLGMALLREGASVRQNAAAGLAGALEEATYLTLDAWSDPAFRPTEAFAQVLSPDEIDVLESLVFSTRSKSVRQRFLIKVQARDLSTVQEQRKQELMILNQFLLGYFAQLAQPLMMLFNPATPPAAKAMVAKFVEKMQAGTEALLRVVEGIDDPRDLVFTKQEIDEFINASNVAMQQAQAQQAGGAAGGGGSPVPTGPAPTDNGTPDLGGGVT